MSSNRCVTSAFYYFDFPIHIKYLGYYLIWELKMLWRCFTILRPIGLTGID